MQKLALSLTVAAALVGLGSVASCSEDSAEKKQSITELTFPYQPEGCGYEVSPPSSIEEAVGHRAEIGPAPEPKQVHITWAGPTESSIALSWVTGLETKLSEALVGSDKAALEAADGPSDGVRRVRGHSMQFGSPLIATQKTRAHEVHVCELDPDTTYYYKVGGPGHWSAVYDIATAPPPGSTAPFRFAVTGDSRGSGQIYPELSKLISAQGVDFGIFTGDFVNIAVDQTDWEKFFEGASGGYATQDLIATRPLMPVNGNHDNLSVYYVGQFALPQELSPGEGAEGEEWYSFDYANAHFLMLSSEGNSKREIQVDFIEQDLAKVDRAKTPWVFVAFHRAPYTCGSAHQNHSLHPRATWQPLFDKYEVDVVLTGHVHNYQRSLPIRGFKPGTTDGQVAQAGANGEPVSGSGTVYIVSGGATEATYDTDPASTCEFSHFTEETNHYAIFEIEDKKLNYRAVRLDGSEMDAFSTTK